MVVILSKIRKISTGSHLFQKIFFSKVVLILITALPFIFPQTTFSQQFSGYLGPGDAIITRDGVSACYPKYMEWRNLNLYRNHKYKCIIFSKEFRPKLSIVDQNELGSWKRTPIDFKYWRASDGNFVYEVEFQTLPDTYQTSFEITSYDDSENGQTPRGNYAVKCAYEPAPPPPPIPPEPTPPSPCLDPPLLAMDSKPDFVTVQPPYGGEAPWFLHNDKYWKGDEYLIITANGNLEKYDKCQNLISRHIRTSTNIRTDGREEWSGYSEDPSGNRIDGGWNWRLIWNH